jgi:hypothetical protein
VVVHKGNGFKPSVQEPAQFVGLCLQISFPYEEKVLGKVWGDFAKIYYYSTVAAFLELQGLCQIQDQAVNLSRLHCGDLR